MPISAAERHLGTLGYAEPAYADSLAFAGEVLQLPRTGGSLIVRPTPDGRAVDATGPYPVFDCRDWSGLLDDLRSLPRDIVSVVLVSDAFATSAAMAIEAARPDVMRRYKEHYVIDLGRPASEVGRASRRRSAAKAMSLVDVKAVPGSLADASEWAGLYEHVIRRHSVTGLAAFPAKSLADQLLLPGAELLTARTGGELIAAEVCLRRGDVVYAHLGASSETGYRLRAMHALDLFAVQHYAQTAAWFDLGGGNGRSDDGLAAYKASWATDTRPTWLAGWITDRPEYERAVVERQAGGTDFFPSYRAVGPTNRTG